MNKTSILIGIGANLAPDGYATPRDGCEAAIAGLCELGIDVLAVSPWYETAPVPVSDQPWFNNAVIAATTAMTAPDALVALHSIEAGFGVSGRYETPPACWISICWTMAARHMMTTM